MSHKPGPDNEISRLEGEEIELYSYVLELWGEIARRTERGVDADDAWAKYNELVMRYRQLGRDIEAARRRRGWPT